MSNLAERERRQEKKAMRAMEHGNLAGALQHERHAERLEDAREWRQAERREERREERQEMRQAERALRQDARILEKEAAFAAAPPVIVANQPVGYYGQPAPVAAMPQPVGVRYVIPPPLASYEMNAILAYAAEHRLTVTEQTMQRLQSGLLVMANRANRSTSVIIANHTETNFELVDAREPHSRADGSGSWNPALYPNQMIPARSIVVHGCDSHSPLHGVTHARVEYKEYGGMEHIVMVTHNPLVGEDSAHHEGSARYRIEQHVGHGNHNHVQFDIHYKL